MQFEIYDLFCPVGEIIIKQESLYYTYQALITTQREGFLRLYCHNDAEDIPIGLFSEKCGKLMCSGRISVRRMGDPYLSHFSLNREKWFYASEGRILRREDACGAEWIVDRSDDLPAELLPYFCFLVPKKVEEIPCLSLRLDKQGRPYLPD